MLTHYQYEQEVYERLSALRDEHPDWHFAMRHRAKNLERQRFIGAEGRYFGTTFWKITTDSFTGPAYPLGLYFWPTEHGYGYHLEGRQTRLGTTDRDHALLDLINSLLDTEFTSRASGRDEENNNQVVYIKARQASYSSLDELFVDLQQDLEIFVPLVDGKLQQAKEVDDQFKFRRFTQEDTDKFNRKFAERTAALSIPDDASGEKAAAATPETAQVSPSATALNQILYGPPGTGKTYSTISRAVAIVEGKHLDVLQRDERAEVLTRYRQYREEGRILFTTFHQSLSYEDFVEGLKPEVDTTEKKDGEVRYTIKAGVFKELVQTVKTANAASANAETQQGLRIDKQLIQHSQPYKISLGDSTDDNDIGIYEYCVENDCIALGYGGEVNFTQASNEKEIIEAIREQRQEEPLSTYEIIAVKVFRLWMQEGDLVFVPDGLLTVRAVGVITSDYYCDPDAPIRYSQFRKVRWLYTNIAFPIKEIYGKQFSVQTTYGMYTAPMREGLLRQHDHRPASDNHVLIIDEINRGNVSAILGELITLLEPDKRLGAAEELTVTLPYSRDEFGVPPNLYIIGTMNTADRSVEALDAALRRRFVFEEVGPDPEVIREVLGEEGVNIDVNGQTVNLVELLRLLNDRIAALKDSDHLLGHSYFLKVKSWEDLSAVMVDRVVPLLREYFFANYAQLQLVVGNAFCRSETAKQTQFAKSDDPSQDFGDELRTYTFPRPKSAQELQEFFTQMAYPWEGQS